jgi:predicted dehydrogenase
MACDTSQDRLAHMKSLYPQVKTTTSFAEVVGNAEVHAVAIATPISSHYPLAKLCLESGKHIFVEKPFAASVAECWDLLNIAERNELVIMVGHTFIFTPSVQFIKELITSGELGEIYSINSARLNLGLFQQDINVAWDLAPHDLSIIMHLLDETPMSVNCQGTAHVHSQLEDVTNMSLYFQSGAFASIQSSWLDPNKIRKMTIVGSKRMVVYDDIEPMEKIKIYDKSVEVPAHYDTFGEFQYSYHYGDMQAPFIRQVEPLKVECQHFLDCIKTGQRPKTSGWDGLKVVSILEASSESLKQGGNRVELPLDEKVGA